MRRRNLLREYHFACPKMTRKFGKLPTHTQLVSSCRNCSLGAVHGRSDLCGNKFWHCASMCHKMLKKVRMVDATVNFAGKYYISSTNRWNACSCICMKASPQRKRKLRRTLSSFFSRFAWTRTVMVKLHSFLQPVRDATQHQSAVRSGG